MERASYTELDLYRWERKSLGGRDRADRPGEATSRRMTILQAEGAVLEEVLDQSYPMWGEGLSRKAYGTWNRAQLETPWGRGHLTRVALSEGAELRSSAKRYDFEARLDGRTVPVVGIGAVFTPPAQRGRGYAAGLIERMLQDAQARGCRLGLA